jgi:hypothetical protein
MVIPAQLVNLVGDIRRDLSRRLAVAETAIAFLHSTPVDWPDSSLGCPEPGMMYAQVITPGYQIGLAVGDELYYYHTNGVRGFKYCPGAAPAAPSTGQ